MVAPEAQPEEGGHRARHAVRHVEQDLERGPALRPLEQDANLPTRRPPAERPRLVLHDHEAHGGRTRGTASVDVLLEQTQDLGPPPLPPLRPVPHRPPVEEAQGVGQRVGGHPCLVVVGPGRLSETGAGDESETEQDASRRAGTRRAHASSFAITFPLTSVRRKSRPWNRKISLVWSTPRRWSTVAWMSCTSTESSTAL